MVRAALWLREAGSPPSANTQAVGGKPPGKCERWERKGRDVVVCNERYTKNPSSSVAQILIVVWTASDRASNLSCKIPRVLGIDVFYLSSSAGLDSFSVTSWADNSFLALSFWTSSNLHQKGMVTFEF